MKQGDSVAFVVDDDASMRQAIGSLIRSVGLRVEPSKRRKSFCKANISIRSAVWCWTCGYQVSAGWIYSAN
jgi:FixJ family two-component response regulator